MKIKPHPPPSTSNSKSQIQVFSILVMCQICIYKCNFCKSVSVALNSFYHPRMRVGNVFGHVCLCVCLCVCLSVFLSVQAITFEPLDIETSFLVCRYILTISRSSLSIKVIGSRSYEKK